MNQMKVRVPTGVVRNTYVSLTSGEFLLYVRLCYLFFRNYQKEEIHIDHKKLMGNLFITSTKILKKRLLTLYESGLIKNKIELLPKKKELVILFNDEVMKKDKHFTQLSVNLFNHLEDIGDHSFRLLYYYKSFINHKQDSRNFCFVGIVTTKNDLKIGGTSISESHKMLQKHKLLKIEKHELQITDDYDDNDELIFNRYNNHYYISDKIL